MKEKNIKGITLVALVITIVILLILAGITIQAITNTGLFANAKRATEESKYANAEEKVKMAVMASYDENANLNKDLLKDNLNKVDGINPKVTEVNWDLKVNVDGYEFTITEYGTVTCVGRKDQEKLPENSKDNPQDAGKEVALKDSWKIQTARHIKTKDGSEVTEVEKVSTVYAVSVGNGETVPVPYGFYYVGGSVDTGVIISDNEADKYDGKIDKTTHEYATKLKGNQFVWIPCTIDEYTKIDFGMQNMASWDRETNTAEKEQIEKYGGFYVGRYEAGVSTLDEETGKFKDSVTFANNKSLFNLATTENGINNLGWQNYDYIARGKVITDSNYQNKATGNIVEKANSIPYYHADYYTAVEMSDRLYSKNAYVKSGLITGTQWDMMMKFLSDSSDYSDMKSTNWGNYDNVSLSNLRGYYTNVNTSNASTDGFKDASSFTTNSGTNSWVILTTGSTSQVLRKGLYDVAGNLLEWTQETSYRANLGYNTTYNTYNTRGGCFSNEYMSRPACDRGSGCAPNAGTSCGFRPVLYIK
ncbi:MAG: type II secretion system protein [Clostridia bacterium]